MNKYIDIYGENKYLYKKLQNAGGAIPLEYIEEKKDDYTFLIPQIFEHSDKTKFQITQNYIVTQNNKCTVIQNKLDNYINCKGCGVCVITQKNKHEVEFHKKYWWTTAWSMETDPDKNIGKNDKYFLIVPNEHIETKIDTSSGETSYDDIIAQAGNNRQFKNCILMYLNHLVYDAFRFAKQKMGIDVKYVYPSNHYIYNEKEDKGENNLYIVVHFKDNGKNHMHLHCFISGDNNFSSSKTAYENVFDTTGFAMSIEQLYKIIAGKDDKLFYKFDKLVNNIKKIK
jgi:Pyruvate/2-oxoacid:ferredoxin oxidoreductase delta subunit